MLSNYMKKKLYMVAILALVIGGINWAIVGFTGGDLISGLFGKRSMLTNAIFVLVGVAALGIAFYRDSYLPFLGETVMPCSILNEQIPEGADTEVSVSGLAPGAKVLYWATEPGTEGLKILQDWRQAYLEFKNAGVTVAGTDGVAVLKVRKPQPYTVPMKGALEAHVHYRVCGSEGMLGRVETVSLGGKELFTNYVEREETPAPVEEPGAEPIVSASDAENLLNEDAERTAKRSLMAQTGALDESPQPAGAPLDTAF
jgi:uncharacterized membrane protein YuzA (DUF378 family)